MSGTFRQSPISRSRSRALPEPFTLSRATRNDQMANRAPQGREHWQTGLLKRSHRGLNDANENYYHLASTWNRWQAKERRCQCET
jgi:hypothetical protein